MAVSGIEQEDDDSNNDKDKDSKKDFDTEADKEEEDNESLDMGNQYDIEDKLDKFPEEFEKIKFSISK